MLGLVESALSEFSTLNFNKCLWVFGEASSVLDKCLCAIVRFWFSRVIPFLFETRGGVSCYFLTYWRNSFIALSTFRRSFKYEIDRALPQSQYMFICIYLSRLCISGISIPILISSLVLRMSRRSGFYSLCNPPDAL